MAGKRDTVEEGREIITIVRVCWSVTDKWLSEASRSWRSLSGWIGSGYRMALHRSGQAGSKLLMSAWE